MASDSRNRTRTKSGDVDSVGTNAEPASDRIVTLDVDDEGKLVNRATGEEVTSEPTMDDLLPESLWNQHLGPPPQELE